MTPTSDRPAREGTLRVLRASLSAGVRRVVITSSVAAVRNSAGPPPKQPLTEENWTDPTNTHLTPYTRSKTIAERAAWDLVGERDATAQLAVVNPSAILGPTLSARHSSSLELIERLLGGMPMPRLSFSVVDVRDAAELHLLRRDGLARGGRRSFLAAGPSLWISEMAQVLRDGRRSAGGEVRGAFPDVLVAWRRVSTAAGLHSRIWANAASQRKATRLLAGRCVQ
jgi:dihydroflavonol-4-reductase